jgi:GMP synthase (glutamine-hydrolysing)
MILAIRNIDVEGLGYIEDVLNRNVVPFRYYNSPHLSSDWKSFINTNLFDGLIILGGPQSVYEYEKYPYLNFVKEIASDFIQSDKPVLGICLGAQLLSDLLGGRVYKGTNGEELGWYDVSLTRDAWRDEIFSKFSPSFRVFQWHGDTFDLPKDCVRLVTSDNYLNQAFRYKNNVYGLQFHLEVRKSDFLNWAKFYELDDKKTQEILKGFDEYENETRRMCEEIIWNLFIHRGV